jgi:hypothetical protein|tara:strand:- start:4156 stop:4533 length:378 start_codon:yes stop_codon:yes gene_type:complete
MKVEIPNGDLVDKITILKIKQLNVMNEEKLQNIKLEYQTLKPLLEEIGMSENDRLFTDLLDVNEKLWRIEDDLRVLEKDKEFGDTFVNLARAVYFTNDERAEIKKKINLKTGSKLVEEKDYVEYK